MCDLPSDDRVPSTPSPAIDTGPARQRLKPGDRVEALGNFGKPMGAFGTVEMVQEFSVVVLWDGDGRMILGPTWIKKALP
jgi:hypothetical protein